MGVPTMIGSPGIGDRANVILGTFVTPRMGGPMLDDVLTADAPTAHNLSTEWQFEIDLAKWQQANGVSDDELADVIAREAPQAHKRAPWSGARLARAA